MINILGLIYSFFYAGPLGIVAMEGLFALCALAFYFVLSRFRVPSELIGLAIQTLAAILIIALVSMENSNKFMYLLLLFAVVFTLLPYQLLTSLVAIVRQLLKDRLSQINLAKLCVIVLFCGLLCGWAVADRNLWSLEDMMTGSHVLRYENNFYDRYAGRATVIHWSTAVQEDNRDLFLFISAYCVVPLLFLLTFAEALAALKKEQNNV